MLVPDSGRSRHPETVDEVVDVMLEEMSDEDRKVLLEMRREDLFELHFTLGMSIRNRFVYPGGEELKRSVALQRGRVITAPNGDCVALIHGDDVSAAIIIEALWERIQTGREDA